MTLPSAFLFSTVLFCRLAGTPPFCVGTLYRIGLRQKRGTGSDGVLEAYLAEGSAAFGAPFASSTTQTFTTPADRLRFGATVGVAIDAWFDDLKLNNQAMPQARVLHTAASLLTSVFEQLWRWLQVRLSSWLGQPEAAVHVQAPPAGQIWTWYYYAGSQRIAMRVQGSTNPSENGVFYLLTDHLGSTTVTLNTVGPDPLQQRQYVHRLSVYWAEEYGLGDLLLQCEILRPYLY